MEAQKKIKILNLQIRDFSDENNVKPENFSIKRNGAFIGTDPVNGKDRDLIQNFKYRTFIKVKQRDESQNNYDVVSRLHLEIVYIPEKNSYFIVDKSISKFYYEADQFHLLEGDEINFGMGNQIILIQEILREKFQNNEILTLKLVQRKRDLMHEKHLKKEYEYEFSNDGIKQVHIGRVLNHEKTKNDIVIEDDPHVSRQHGKFYIQEDDQKSLQIFYQNLSKTSGTYLRRSGQLEITELQKVYIGPNELTFKIEWEEENKSDIENIEYHLCPVCMYQISNQVINCGHTLCMECLDTLRKSTKICPICRQSIKTQLNFNPVFFK